MEKRDIIRNIYLYIMTFVGIMFTIVGLVGFLSGIINLLIFKLPTPQDPSANIWEYRNLTRDLVSIIVGFPIWLYHWGIINKEKKGLQEEIKPEEKKS